MVRSQKVVTSWPIFGWIMDICCHSIGPEIILPLRGLLFETSKIAGGRAEIDTFWDEWRKSKSQEYVGISDLSLERVQNKKDLCGLSKINFSLAAPKNGLTSFWLASEALLAGCSSSSAAGRSSPKRLSPLLVLVLLFSPSKKVLLLRAMEPEVVGLAGNLSLLSSLPLLFSLPLLDFSPSLSPSMTREEKFVGASRTRGVLGRDRVRSKASSMESTPESFDPLAVRGFDLGRSDRLRCCFYNSLRVTKEEIMIEVKEQQKININILPADLGLD